MSEATGNPVFVTVGGDASAATATPTGGVAPISLADIAAQVAQNKIDATSAKTNASSAASAATKASSDAGTALTTANAAIPKTSMGTAGGPAVLDKNKNPTASGQMTFGLGVGGNQSLNFYTTTGSTSGGYFTFSGGTGKNDAQFWLGASQMATFDAFPLGTTSNPFSGAVLQSAVQVVSDAAEKTIVGTLGDETYAEEDKLLSAWDSISGVIYTLKSGASGRMHVGVIAQAVAAAFTAQGLDAADYGLWCQSPLTEVVELKDDDGKTTGFVEKPVYEADGKTQATRQTVRYEELLCLGIFCERAKAQKLAQRVDAIEKKLNTSPAPQV